MPQHCETTEHSITTSSDRDHVTPRLSTHQCIKDALPRATSLVMEELCSHLGHQQIKGGSRAPGGTAHIDYDLL